MGKYLRKFETTAEYTAYIATDYAKPNVSYIVEENGVAYHPLEPSQPNNIITYNAPSKLAETTYEWASGLRTNAFSGTSGQLTMTSHTFENGVGTVVFSDDVTSIGDNAFKSCIFTSIDIPNSVTSIGKYAFQYCGKLTSIDIPNSVTTIGNMAFASCTSLTSIDIPNSVTTIGSTAFAGCKGLTSCTIGNSVTSIGNYAFEDCSGLTSITSLATTAPSIQSDTFRNVKTNGTLYVQSGSSGYDVWMGTGNYYLGKYNWTKTEQ